MHKLCVSIYRRCGTHRRLQHGTRVVEAGYRTRNFILCNLSEGSGRHLSEVFLLLKAHDKDT